MLFRTLGFTIVSYPYRFYTISQVNDTWIQTANASSMSDIMMFIDVLTIHLHRNGLDI